MGLTIQSSPILGPPNSEAAQALLLLSGAASEDKPSKSSSEDMERCALLALTNRIYPTPTLSPLALKPTLQHKEVGEEVLNLKIHSKDQVMHDSINLSRNGRKRRHSSLNSLHKDVRKCVTRNCRKIFANATEDTLPYLAEELRRFISELYTKGICDQELANKRKSERTALNTESPTGSCDDSSDEDSMAQDLSKSYSRFLSSSITPRAPNDDGLVPIGNGHAKIHARILRHMNWRSHTACTRKLLTAVFSRDVLATHSLTGKSSPAFPDKPAKKKLDPLLVNDIIMTIVDKCGVSESQVRTSITTKCADESKMSRTREQKETKGKGHGKRSRENIPPYTSESDE